MTGLLVFAGLAYFAGAQSAQPQDAKAGAKAEVTAMAVGLYEIRVEAARLDLAADELDVAHLRGRYENYVKLSTDGATAAAQVTEAKYLLDKAVLERAVSRNFVAEVEAQAGLVKAAVKAGVFGAEDIRLAAEPRQRRK